MTKSTRRREKKRKPVIPIPAGPYAGIERKARKLATKLGLYLLAEGEGLKSRWVLYSVRSGQVLLTYYPATLHWLSPREQGHVQNWYGAIQQARCLDHAPCPT